MKLRTLLWSAVMMLTVSVQAQELRILVDKKGKVGFADPNGNEIIKCQYETAMPFKDGIAIVSKSGKSGIIDEKGQVLLPLKYSQILKWNDELFIIKDGKDNGLADKRGNIVLPVDYSNITKPNCYGKALIAKGGKAVTNEKKTYIANAKYGIIDSKGKILIEPKYKGLYEFSFDGTKKFPYYEGKRLEYSYHYITDTLVTDCSYLGFSKNPFAIYKAGIMDANGTELMKQGLYDFFMIPRNGMVRYYIVKKKQTLCGYHDLNLGKGFQVAVFKKYIDNIDFWTHGDFTENIAPVNGDSWSIIDRTGQTLRTGYQSLKHSSVTGLWAAKNGTGTWDVFDEANKDVAALSGYSEINFPVHKDDREVYSVGKDGKYGCITRTGETVVAFEYDYMMGNTCDYLLVKKNSKWGMLTADNQPVVPTEYAGLVIPVERNTGDVWVKKDDSLYYHMTLKTKNVFPVPFKKVFTNFIDGISHAAPADMVVQDTKANRAQVCKPNAKRDQLDKINMEEQAGMFGYLIDTENRWVFDMPVSTLYRDYFVKELKKQKERILTKTEKKNLLLDITRENRSYDLQSTLSEEEWNY